MDSDKAPAIDLLTEQEAADTLTLKVPTLQEWRSSGRVRLPFVKLGGAVRYRRSDIEDFIARSVRNTEVQA